MTLTLLHSYLYATRQMLWSVRRVAPVTTDSHWRLNAVADQTTNGQRAGFAPMLGQPVAQTKRPQHIMLTMPTKLISLTRNENRASRTIAPKSNRLLASAIVALGVAVGLFAAGPRANAQTPLHIPQQAEFDYTVTDICSFPIDVHASLTGTATLLFNKDGSVRVVFHANEVDTFSANGKSIQTEPYTYNLHVLFDPAGNLIQNTQAGVVVRMWLPDGTLFISAGRVDALNVTGYLISPDSGHTGNIDAFCAALAP
jgi:hypothetical protein